MAQIFITGSSDGLGLLAAQELLSLGHKVVCHARNEERAINTLGKICECEKVIVGDLSSMEETIQIAKQVNELGPFDAIIHNSGVYQVPASARSKDDLPLAFAVNSIAPYILTALIHRPLRLIYLSSNMHFHGNASDEALNGILSGQNIPSYSDTKLHDLILAFTVARKFPAVSSNAVDPGWVPTKMGGPSAPDNLIKGYKTQVWLAAGQEKEAKLSGRYLYHQKARNFNPQAKVEEIQDKFLWVCQQLTGITLK